jgi:hypothetical protein
MSRHDPNENRKPSSKSTKKNKNAMIHGVYSKDVILPFESREDFEALFADLRLELRSDGRLEDEIVFDVALGRWHKRRMVKMWAVNANSDPFVGHLIRSGKKSLSGVRSYLRREGKSFRNAAEVMGRLAAETTAGAKKIAGDIMTAGFEESEIEQAEKKLEKIKSLIDRGILPLMRTLEQGPSADNTLERTYSPEYLEPILRLERAFDAHEAKLLSKLVRIQEYKRLRESYETGPALTEGGRSKLLELKSQRKFNPDD